MSVSMQLADIEVRIVALSGRLSGEGIERAKAGWHWIKSCGVQINSEWDEEHWQVKTTSQASQVATNNDHQQDKHLMKSVDIIGDQLMAGTVDYRQRALRVEGDDFIMGLRGGRGCYDLSNCLWPKSTCLIGFSDMTASFAPAYGQLRMLHADVLTTISAQPKWCKQRFCQAITNNPLPDLKGQPQRSKQLSANPVAKGRLFVANLTTLALLADQDLPWKRWPEPMILVLEDCNEALNAIYRALQRLSKSGVFDQLAGLCLGRFEWLDVDTKKENDHMDQQLVELVQQWLAQASRQDIPLITDLPIGHRPGDGNAACIQGAPCTINAAEGYLRHHTTLWDPRNLNQVPQCP